MSNDVKPAFDPNQKFEAVDSSLEAKPEFDPNKPFDEVPAEDEEDGKGFFDHATEFVSDTIRKVPEQLEGLGHTIQNVYKARGEIIKHPIDSAKAYGSQAIDNLTGGNVGHDWALEERQKLPAVTQLGGVAGSSVVPLGAAVATGGASLPAQVAAGGAALYGSNVAARTAADQPLGEAAKEALSDTAAQGVLAGTGKQLSKLTPKQIQERAIANTRKKMGAKEGTAQREAFDRLLENPEQVGPDAQEALVKSVDERKAVAEATDARKAEIKKQKEAHSLEVDRFKQEEASKNQAYKQSKEDHNVMRELQEENIKRAEKEFETLQKEAFEKQLQSDQAFVEKAGHAFEKLKQRVEVARGHLSQERGQMFTKYKNEMPSGEVVELVKSLYEEAATHPENMSLQFKIKGFADSAKQQLDALGNNLTRGDELVIMHDGRSKLGSTTSFDASGANSMGLRKAYRRVNEVFDSLPNAGEVRKLTNDFAKTYRLEEAINKHASRKGVGKTALLDEEGNVVEPGQPQRVYKYHGAKAKKTFKDADIGQEILGVLDDSGNVPLNKDGTPLVDPNTRLLVSEGLKKAQTPKEALAQQMRERIEAKKRHLHTSVNPPRPEPQRPAPGIAPEAPVEPPPVAPESQLTTDVQLVKDAQRASSSPTLEWLKDRIPYKFRHLEPNKSKGTALDLVAKQAKRNAQHPAWLKTKEIVAGTPGALTQLSATPALNDKPAARSWLKIVSKTPNKTITREAVDSASNLYDVPPEDLEQALFSLGIEITP